MDIEQYITYQHNVQRFFREHPEKYAGVIIPLSIATSFPTGTYGFVRALCSKHNHKYYAIDPRTALFQRQWGRQNVRPPHKRMAEILGGPFKKRALKSPLNPEDFSEDSTLAEITRECLSFQMEFKARKEDARKIKKYKVLLGLSELSDLGNPQFLIPPYFLFRKIDDEWYKISINCIKHAIGMECEAPIRPILHFAEWPQGKNWKGVVRAIKAAGLESCWVYPDCYKEHEEELDSLRNYRAAVETTASEGVAPYALFGGYYAVLMHYYGLRGFGNGIGYGEWRDSGYHRGGTAMTRVYVMKLHRYLDAPDAQHIIERDPGYFADDTELLSECAATGRRLTDLTQAECLDHFMECRYAEMEFVSNNPLASAVRELEETYEYLKEIGPFEEKYGVSLKRWADALTQSGA